MGSPFDAMFSAAGAPALAFTFGITATIQRSTQRTPNVRVTMRKRDYEVLNEDTGVPQIVSMWDFLVDAADYTFDDAVQEPRQGDRLTATVDGTERQFEATPVGKRPAVEPEDPSHKRWLIHTNQVQ